MSVSVTFISDVNRYNSASCRTQNVSIHAAISSPQQLSKFRVFCLFVCLLNKLDYIQSTACCVFLSHQMGPLIPPNKTDIYPNSFVPSTTTLWKSIPENIKQSTSISELKRYLFFSDTTVPPNYYKGKRKEQITHCRLCLETAMGSHPVSSRLITIRLRAVSFNITIVQVYAPTSDYDDNEIEEFCDKL